MSQAGSSDREKMLQDYWRKLQQIQEHLKPGIQLRDMNNLIIADFIQDLVHIDEEVTTLNNESVIHDPRLVDLSHSFHSNISKAIIELNLALDVLDWEGKLEASSKDISLNARRDFYECLNHCQQYIHAALQDLGKWRT